MATALLDRPTRTMPSARPKPRAAAPTSRAERHPTLEGIIAGAWEGLAAHRGVGCPLCGGTMTPRYGASGPAPVGGRCTDCGTTLG